MKISAMFSWFAKVCFLGFVHNMRQSVDLLASAAVCVCYRVRVCVSVYMCAKWPFQLGASRQSGGGWGL